MMNVKVTDAGCFVEGSGSGSDMLCDICVIINEVYSILHKHNPSDARAFRTLLSGLMADPCSPIWEPSSGSDGICSMDDWADWEQRHAQLRLEV